MRASLGVSFSAAVLFAASAVTVVSPASAQKDDPAAPPAGPAIPAAAPATAANPAPPAPPPPVARPLSAQPYVRPVMVPVPAKGAARTRIMRKPVWSHGRRVADAPLIAGLPIASFPGFSRLEDGKSRIFIEVDAKVDVVERRDPNKLVYRLRNTGVTQHTNALALVTSYFSTPVDRVQLVQEGTDVNVVIELREATTPTFQVVETPRGIVLWVDFPRSTSFREPGQTANGVEVDDTSGGAKRITTSQTIGILRGPGGGDPAAPPAAPAAPVPAH